MNTAYRSYLTDALDHYMCNEDDDQAIHRFLDWLNDYQPDKNSVHEPGLYTYGDAQHQYAPIYLDDTSFADHDVDIDKLTAKTGKSFDQLLDEWASRMGETIFASDHACEALAALLDHYGLTINDVTA